MEHPNLHFPNLTNFGFLGRKAQFFAPWDPVFKIRPMSYFTLWYSQYQEHSNHISFAWIQLFYQIWQARTKTVWLIFGCTLLNDQSSNSNCFIVVKIPAWLSLICWVVPAGHLWVFDKHNAGPIEGLGLLHMRGSGVKGLTIFLGFICLPLVF